MRILQSHRAKVPKVEDTAGNVCLTADACRDVLDKGEIQDTDAREAANVAEWRKVLPEDCVAAMVRDGRHRRL